MQKNLFDLKLLRFSKYLNDIGVLSKLSTEKFQKYFHEITTDLYNSKDISVNNINLNFIYFKKYILSAFIKYIQSLSEEEQKLLALNIYDKYNSKENQIDEKLIKIIDIYSKQQVRACFNKWKSEIIILTNSLKKVISSNILSSIQNSINSKLIQNIKKLNIPNENINININNNRIINSNNSMLNINPNLNISTNPDIYNNNINNINNTNYNYPNHNTSFNENNNINNYSIKNRRKVYDECRKTYSINNFNPSNNYIYNYNYINSNYHNDSYKYIQNYLNKTNSHLHQIPKNIKTGNNLSFMDKTKSYASNTHSNKSSKKAKKTKVNIEYINNLSKSKTEHNIIPERTSAYIKEQEEFDNYCTFKPKINKSSSYSRYWNSSNKRPIDRLYLDSKNRIARKELEFLKKANLESKQNTFQPRFISSSVKRVKSDFDKRLKEFEINKKNKMKKLSEDIEEEQKQQFTFSPKINEFIYNNTNNCNKRNINNINNNNYTMSNMSKNSTINQSMLSKTNTNNKKIPAYKRLYNENKNKIIRQKEREKEELEKIKKNSSKMSEGNNNNILDKKKIEELYNDYKMKKTRLKMKQEEIEKEQGITFHPELISDKNYFNKINPDFYMREKIFLEKQQKNIEIYKQYLEKEKNIKKYSEEEKKDIYNNIVERLYKNGIEKLKEKQVNNNYKNTLDDNISEKEIKNELFFKNNFNANESDISSQKIY